jgi:predicted nucleic acid-binding protein
LSVYVDTGILVKSYVFEEDSPEAIALIEAAGDPLIFSHVHEIEIPNAIRLKRFRGEITRAEEAAAIRVFRSDVDAGRLVRPDYDLAEVFIQAERLSAKFSGDHGSRSLDVLHIAAALQSGCVSLASFDERQRKIGALAGLKLLPAKKKKP